VSQIEGEPVGDLTWFAFQRLGEVERSGEGEVAQLHAGRVLERDPVQGNVKGGAGGGPYGLGELGVQIQDHLFHDTRSESPAEAHEILGSAV
jgi:hypothetical protein